MVLAPVATDPLAGEITGTSAVIEWTTDEPMTGEVQFGLDNLYGTVAGSGGLLDHVVLLAGLTPATFYHFRVKNHSAGGETVYSFDRTFQTPAAGVTSPLSGKYTFDSHVQGWVAQDYVDSRAVQSVDYTTLNFAQNPGALLLNWICVGDISNGPRGKRMFSLKTKPRSVTVPMGFMNLDLRPITVWIFAPVGAIGDPGQPNGIQVFAKDSSGGANMVLSLTFRKGFGSRSATRRRERIYHVWF